MRRSPIRALREEALDRSALRHLLRAIEFESVRILVRACSTHVVCANDPLKYAHSPRCPPFRVPARDRRAKAHGDPRSSLRFDIGPRTGAARPRPLALDRPWNNSNVRENGDLDVPHNAE